MRFAGRNLNRISYCCALLLVPAFAAAQSFTIGVNVQGTTSSELPALNGGFSFIPPDTMGAIGPTSFAEFTNGSFAVYNKTDGSLIGSRVGLTTFWQNAGITGLSAGGTGSLAGASDTHILYDPTSSRWFAVGIDTPSSGTNRLLVAVSTTSDPTAAWKGFAVASSATKNSFGDFPAIGLNQDALYVSTNNFSGSTAVSVGINVFPKSQLLAATPTATGRTLFDQVDPSTTGFTAHPITNLNNATGSEPILSALNSTSLKLSTLLNTNTSTPTLNTSIAPLTSISATPGHAHQPSGTNTIDAGDTRFSANVIQQENNIWGTQTVKDSVTGMDDIKWTRINATTHDIEESGTIGDSTHDYYYGSIAVNPTGQVVIGYTRSGSTQFASSYASVGQFNGTATQFLLPTLLQAGAGNYNVTGGGSNRWGDYSQTTIDPLDSLKFWTIEEYASGTNTWSTAITEIDFAAAPEPSSLAMLLLIGATLSLRRRRQPRPSGTLAFGG